VEAAVSDVSKTPVTADAAAFASARGTSPTAAKATPRLRRDEPQRKEAGKRLVPAASSFDLLDGEYVKNRKSRVLSIVGLAVSALVVVLMSAQLLRIRLEISSARSQYDQFSAQGSDSKAALDQLSQFEGVPGDIVSEALEGRSLQAAAATEGEVDLAVIVNDLTTMVPQGVTIDQIQVSTPADLALATVAGATSAKPAAEGKEKGEGESGPPVATITVLATADSIASIDPLLASLRQSSTLSSFQETWAGKPPAVSVRIEIKVAVGRSERFSGFLDDTGLAPESETTDTATAPAEGS
jgi:hypothetical protein